MKAKSKQWQWVLVGVMILAMMGVPLFSETTGSTGGPETLKSKIYYLKSGEDQYFYLKTASGIGCFLISPNVEATIKTGGQTRPITGLNHLERYISIEISGIIKDPGGDPQKNKKTKLDYKISKVDNKYILKFKEGRNEKEEKKERKDEFNALVIEKINSSTQTIQDKDIKINVTFTPVELGVNQLDTAGIDSFLDLLEEKKSFSARFFANGQEPPSSTDFEDIKKILEQNKETPFFDGWRNHFQDYELMNLGSIDNPSDTFKKLFEDPVTQPVHTSSQLMPFLKIILPLLAVLAGIFLMYKFLVLNYLADLKEIKAQVKKPQTLQQAVAAINAYLNSKESKRTRPTNKIYKKKNQGDNSMQPQESAKDEDLKNIKESFMKIEKNIENISPDDIEKIEQEISKLKGKIENDPTLQQSDFKNILAFIAYDFPLIAAKIKKQCKMTAKIDAIGTQNQSFEEKLQFIKERTSNPGSIADAVFLVQQLVDEIDRDVDKKYDEIPCNDLEKQKEKDDWKTKKENLTKAFYEGIFVIVGSYSGFDGKVLELKEKFKEFAQHYQKMIKGSPLENSFPGYSGDIDKRFIYIEKKVTSLNNEYNEYSKLKEHLTELSEGLGDNEKQLKENLEKAQAIKDELKNSLNTQNSKGQEFLQAVDDHVKALGTERDKINEVTNKLNEQNNQVSNNSINIDNYTKQLKTHLETVKGTVKELQEKIDGIRTVSGELNSSKGKLDNEVTRISNVVKNLEEQRLGDVKAAAKVKNDIKDLDEKVKEVEKIISGLSGQYEKCESVTTRLKETSDKWPDEQTKLESVIDKLSAKATLEKEVANTLKAQVQALNNRVADVNLIINELTQENNKESRLFDNLHEKALVITSSIAQSQEILNSLETQNVTGEGMNNLFSSKLNDLSDHLAKVKAASEELHRHNVKGEQTVNSLAKFAEDLNARLTSDNTPELDLYREFINDELLLNLSNQTSSKVLKRLKGEPSLSKEYRYCGINLYKDLIPLEKKLKDKWYWRLIKPIKDGLDFNIRSFYRRDGKTIYDTYMENGSPSFELSTIKEENIKTVIDEMHWTQIWEHLIKAAGFFDVYFDDDMKNVTDMLRGAQQKIITLMESYLGYQVEIHKPLQLIPKRLVETGEVKESSNHFVFYREILPEIKNSKRLLGAEAVYREESDNKLILFVDTLGLIDNGKRIRKPQVVIYYPDTPKQHQ